MPTTQRNFLQLCLSLLLLVIASVQAWVPLSCGTRRPLALASSTSVDAKSDSLATTINNNSDDEDEDDDEEEYEYVEYDILKETDFMGSEWLVGTVMEGDPNRIRETWVRLATDKDGKNVAIWGDNSQGTWSLDVASQFLSMSKESLVGKDIWAGVVDDFYFTQGSVRGWNFFSPASVLGQWQAKRLGVDKDEAGVAPWFEEDEEEEEGKAEEPKASEEESASK